VTTMWKGLSVGRGISVRVAGFRQAFIEQHGQKGIEFRRPGSRAEFILHALVHLLLLAIIASVFFPSLSVARTSMIKGDSMVPAIHNGDVALIVKYVFGDSPSRGDVVSFKDVTGESSGNLIKRVVAVGGDVLTYRGWTILVNGVKPYRNVLLVARPYEMKVPDGMVFVIGDNQDDSYDSRLFGPVPVEMINGRAAYLVWPPGVAGMTP